MSELAYDVEGDRFEVPASAAGWRVRRFRNVGARGAPEVVFGEDGRPLVLPVDAGIDEFRVAVAGVPGRYRLDPVDVNGRVVEKAPAAYLQFGDTPRSPSGGGAVAAAMSSHDGMLGEVVRANAEMVKVIADRFGGVMEAAATLLKAADGAGLPARKPLEPLRNAAGDGGGGDDDDDDDEADEDEDEEEREPGIGDFIGQVMPLVQMVMARQSATKAPRVMRNAAGERADDGERAGPAPPERTAKKAVRAAGAITPGMLMHFQAIQAQLSTEEAEFARAVAAELGPAEIQEWMAELSGMSVDDAVATVRRYIAGKGSAT